MYKVGCCLYYAVNSVFVDLQAFTDLPPNVQSYLPCFTTGESSSDMWSSTFQPVSWTETRTHHHNNSSSSLNISGCYCLCNTTGATQEKDVPCSCCWKRKAVHSCIAYLVFFVLNTISFQCIILCIVFGQGGGFFERRKKDTENLCCCCTLLACSVLSVGLFSAQYTCTIIVEQ